jgi:type 1 glutamine amidotransferase
VVLTYDMHQTISDRAKKNLQDFVEGGKGLVILHHAICGYNNWEWWWREVMAGRYILKAEPGFAASTWKHDQELFVRPVMKHPVVGDIGPMHIIDETYSGVWVSKDAKVLMTTDHPLVNGPVAWISPYEKSRVVTIVLGHDHQVHANAGFRQLIKNAVSWTASKQ